MKLLITLALVLTIASAFDLRGTETNSSSAVVPVIKKEGRITNGETAWESLLPYQVGLSLKQNILFGGWCGGSLIDNQWVLTAAHCIDDARSAKVHLGAFVRTKPEVTFTVSKKDFIIHPHWNRETGSNDIALIKIPSVSLSNTIQVIELPARTDSYSSYNGEYVIASGWGRTSDDDERLPKELQYARLQVISNRVCKQSYSGPFTTKQICVATEGGTSICQGDSGGPLVLESDNVQIGVASFVSEIGCEKGRPAAFTRLTSYLDWIHSHTGIAY